jgi:hypothetical protein
LKMVLKYPNELPIKKQTSTEYWFKSQPSLTKKMVPFTRLLTDPESLQLVKAAEEAAQKIVEQNQGRESWRKGVLPVRQKRSEKRAKSTQERAAAIEEGGEERARVERAQKKEEKERAKDELL